ncbi:MAG: glycosyltransferase [Acidobacteria bacterium]|nr:glycosyltransferase [Acidobacteriota bacterium]
MKLAVVLVHYHTPWLVPPAVAALRDDLETAGIEHELLLVDNGSEAGDREVFEALGLTVLEPGTNRGYAAGFNRGVAASDAEVLSVMNPDVEVRRGCFPRLLEALEAGAAAAGPAFAWDSRHRVLLPPAEPRTRTWEAATALASRGDGWAAMARRRWRRHARRHWQADAPIPSYSLSGALLTLRRDAWERVGPFDDGYRLYFEETDWLERLRRARLGSVYVPAAHARHRYNRSAVSEPRAARWFAESSERFRRRFYGAWFSSLLEKMVRPPQPQPPRVVVPEELMAADRPPVLELAPGATWIELSPIATGFPAAAERLDRQAGQEGGRWCVPEEIWGDLAPGRYWVRSVGPRGQELGLASFARPAFPDR